MLITALVLRGFESLERLEVAKAIKLYDPIISVAARTATKLKTLEALGIYILRDGKADFQEMTTILERITTLKIWILPFNDQYPILDNITRLEIPRLPERWNLANFANVTHLDVKIFHLPHAADLGFPHVLTLRISGFTGISMSGAKLTFPKLQILIHNTSEYSSLRCFHAPNLKEIQFRQRLSSLAPFIDLVTCHTFPLHPKIAIFSYPVHTQLMRSIGTLFQSVKRLTLSLDKVGMDWDLVKSLVLGDIKRRQWTFHSEDSPGQRVLHWQIVSTWPMLEYLQLRLDCNRTQEDNEFDPSIGTTWREFAQSIMKARKEKLEFLSILWADGCTLWCSQEDIAS
jgi:hypothetical protein